MKLYNLTTAVFTLFIIFIFTDSLRAQNVDTVSPFKAHGNLWGLAFGDYVYKGNADTVGGGLGRGSNQYSKMPAGTRIFQFRRVYLGYNYGYRVYKCDGRECSGYDNSTATTPDHNRCR